MWCIENEMWNEARAHLERAITQDSLSASLHNNLGIVYERLGMVDKATDFYSRAQALNPSKKAYAANLSYLQLRQQAAHDSTGEFNLFRLERDHRPDARRTGERPPYTGE
jgi:Flp pilus assembly protein TadD